MRTDGYLFVRVEGGQDHDLGRVLTTAQSLRGRQPVHRRHTDVHQDDVRAGPVDQRLDLAAVAGRTNDLDVVGPAHHEGRARPHQRVVDEEQSDRSHVPYGITGVRPMGPPGVRDRRRPTGERPTTPYEVHGLWAADRTGGNGVTFRKLIEPEANSPS